jgi:hypothetical protein
MSNLEFRLASGCGVPLLLAVLGIIGKKLTRGKGTPSWKRTDFYLGVEFTLAGVSAALINLLDLLLKPGTQIQVSDGRIILGNILTLVFGMMLFMFVLSLHQDYENESNAGALRKRELKVLAGVSNTIGFAVLLAGVVLIPN